VGRTRVDDKTVFKRGKSLIPASRMLIEESRRVSDERREVTDALSEARDCEVDIFVLLWQIIRLRCRLLCAIENVEERIVLLSRFDGGCGCQYLVSGHAILVGMLARDSRAILISCYSHNFSSFFFPSKSIEALYRSVRRISCQILHIPSVIIVAY
jgi:hypothetical protein